MEIKYLEDSNDYLLVVALILEDETGKHRLVSYSTFHTTYTEIIDKFML